MKNVAITTVVLWSCVACSSSGAPATTQTAPAKDLAARAYIVSRDSDDVTVIDLNRLEILGSVRTGGKRDHMLEVSADLTKAFVDSPGTDESVVLDTRALSVVDRIPLPAEPTHVTLSKQGHLIAIVSEDANAVSFVDPSTNAVIKTLPGFYTPHFVRFAPDGRAAYVANIGASHVTRVDLSTLAIDAEIPLDGTAVPTPVDGESGFADAQIDGDGILYAAHAAAGRVLVYDTKAQKKIGEVAVGAKPWIVYAEHPFAGIRPHLVPNFGDATVSVLQGAASLAVIGGADSQSYGVNYSPLVPDQAFVMNRFRQEIAVVDVNTHARVDSIDVGGRTETASTTPDGKWIVATVSSANRVVVVDAATHAIVKTFDGVGRYPWSVTIPGGQNYCH